MIHRAGGLFVGSPTLIRCVCAQHEFAGGTHRGAGLKSDAGPQAPGPRRPVAEIGHHVHVVSRPGLGKLGGVGFWVTLGRDLREPLIAAFSVLDHVDVPPSDQRKYRA